MSEPYDLITAHLDRVATEEQCASLDAWINASPANARCFVREAIVHSHLRDLFVAEQVLAEAEAALAGPAAPDVEPEVEPVREVPSPLRLAPPPAHQPRVPDMPRRGLLGIAAVLLIGASLLVFLVFHARHSGTATPQGQDAAISTILANAINAQWDAPNQGLQPGATLAPAPLFLKAGLAELCYSNGVTVLVEAPARLTVRAANTIDLSYGKIVAVVPSNARGFSVQTPSAHVVDLGTEFGVEVSDDRSTHLEVFRGSVRAEIIGSGGNRISQTLVADQAARIPAGEAEIDPANRAPLRFVRPAEVTFAANAAYERWRAFSDALRSDSSLIAYYTFDNAQEAPDLLLNRSAAGHELDGVLEAGDAQARPRWTTGRWEQKGALAFSGATRVTLGGKSRLDFSREGQTAAPFTIAAWLEGELNQQDGSILCRGDERKEQYAVGLRFGTFRGWIRKENSPAWGDGVIVESRVPPRGWQHVVEVYDPSQASLSFYVNGQRVAENLAAPRALLASSAATVLGSRPSGPGFLPAFAGKVDELAIFNRPLSAGEINRLYQAGTRGP